MFLRSNTEQMISTILGIMLLFNYFTHQGGNMTETYALIMIWLLDGGKKGRMDFSGSLLRKC